MNDSIALTGFSNTGKSTTVTPMLEALGFERVCVDEEIEKRLGPELTRLGHHGTDGMAAWMGQPYDEQYPLNSQIYLEHEIDVMWQVLGRLKRGEKLVVDTTGSVIYTGQRTLDRLKERATVVLLDASDGLLEELYMQYLAKPKPRIWGDATYAPLPGEDREEALKRCFPDLLATRNARYRNLAHFAIDYRVFREPGFTGKTLLEMIGVGAVKH